MRALWTFQLNEARLNTVMKALSKLPFEEAVDPINEMSRQIQEQRQADEAPKTNGADKGSDIHVN